MYYFYALYQKIVKREQIIENSQNIRNSQNFNVVALFALEISTLFFIFILYFYAVSQKLTKTEQTIVKLPNIQQILLNTRASLNQNLNFAASFVFELLGFVF